MPKIKLVVNPVSGRGAGLRSVPYLEENLKDLHPSLVLTERPGHAQELACEAVASGFEVVVAVGGDGTSNEVLNGLVQAQLKGVGSAKMGVISVGRGNDFAYGIGVPKGLPEGCQILRQGKTKVIDVGVVSGGFYPQGRYFGNGVGIGFDAVVGFEALKLAPLSGFASYIIAALKTIYLYYTAPIVKITLDDQTIETPALMVSIMNGRRMGGGFMMAPASSTQDGLFDVCIAGQVSRAEIFKLIPRFMKGTQEGHPAIRTIRSRQVAVTALQGSLPAHADGETLCTAGENLAVSLHPAVLEVITMTT